MIPVRSHIGTRSSHPGTLGNDWLLQTQTMCQTQGFMLGDTRPTLGQHVGVAWGRVHPGSPQTCGGCCTSDLGSREGGGAAQKPSVITGLGPRAECMEGQLTPRRGAKSLAGGLGRPCGWLRYLLLCSDPDQLPSLESSERLPGPWAPRSCYAFSECVLDNT